ncbi:MAG: DUF6431 domain-containing protein [Sulfobacillus sp.]|nr:DUF6431 domain-containing protein [Sulfobacillus sp.]
MSPCPHCQGPLRVVGSRGRRRRLPDGTRHVLVIRRLRCDPCARIHHELPDCLVPYRRYDSASLEALATEGPTAAVAAEPSTLRRWEAWFQQWIPYVERCWAALAARHRIPPTARALPWETPLALRAPWVATAGSGWLAAIVQRLVNEALWGQTRSASLT